MEDFIPIKSLVYSSTLDVTWFVTQKLFCDFQNHLRTLTTAN